MNEILYAPVKVKGNEWMQIKKIGENIYERESRDGVTWNKWVLFVFPKDPKRLLGIERIIKRLTAKVLDGKADTE